MFNYPRELHEQIPLDYGKRRRANRSMFVDRDRMMLYKSLKQINGEMSDRASTPVNNDKASTMEFTEITVYSQAMNRY